MQETVAKPLIRVTPKTTRASVRGSRASTLSWSHSREQILDNNSLNSLKNKNILGVFNGLQAQGISRIKDLDSKVAIFSKLHDPSKEFKDDPLIHRPVNLVCYYGSWSHWRSKPGRLSVTSIDPFACTHLIYSFVSINHANFSLIPHDPYLDLSGKDSSGGRRVAAYAKAVGLKRVNPALKVMFSVGGWDAGSQVFSDLTAKRDSRKTFIRSLQSFLKEHSFDGIDIDWEYPSLRHGSRPETDRENLILLLKEIKEDLGRDIIVSVAVAASKYIAQQAYDIPQLNKLTDFVNLMTYDYFGPWTYVVGHNAPLYHKKTGVKNMLDNIDLSVNSSLHFWLQSGMDRSKIMMGIPFYGRTFTLRSSRDSEPFSIADGEGLKGNITNIPGVLSFYETCQLIQERRSKQLEEMLQKQDIHDTNSLFKEPRRVWDEEWKAPYFVHDLDWVSYEDVDSILEKGLFVLQEGLGGAMVWSLDHDDVSGVCGVKEGKEGKFPLLKTLSKTLGINENNIYWSSSLGKQTERPTYDDSQESGSFISSFNSRDLSPPTHIYDIDKPKEDISGVKDWSTTSNEDRVIEPIEEITARNAVRANNSLSFHQNWFSLPNTAISSTSSYPTTLIRVISTTPELPLSFSTEEFSTSPAIVSSPLTPSSAGIISKERNAVTSRSSFARNRSVYPIGSSISRPVFPSLSSSSIKPSYSQNKHLNLLLITIMNSSIAYLHA